MILTFLHDTLWVMDDERAKEITQRERGFSALMASDNCNCPALELDGGFESIGNLARKVLSCTYEARKKAREASGEKASRARHAQTTTTGRSNVAGRVASNENRCGGVDKGSVRKSQQPPNADERLVP
jgi:hypothetical protein